MKYPVRRENFTYRLVHLVLPELGLWSMGFMGLLVVAGLAFGVVAGLLFVALPRDPVAEVPRLRAVAPAGTTAALEPRDITLRLPYLLPTEFRDNLDNDVVNHGGRVVRTLRHRPGGTSAQYAVPESYPARLAALESGELDYRAWSAWAAARPPAVTEQSSTAPAVLLTVDVALRCADHCGLRRVARVALLTAAGALWALLVSGVALFFIEASAERQRGRASSRYQSRESP